MAREVLFWPGMRNSIHDMCSACGTCAQYGNEAPREPMKSLPIPTMSWQIISQDLFAFEKKTYLVTVCHFSDWIEVDELEDTLSATVIAKTKAHFSRYGIPSVCHTDNGPQFISKEYEDFAQQYHFKHTTSSPYHPQGNGKAESAVKVAKAMMKKSDDKELAFLNYRNSPQKGHTYSPAQRMMNRRTRTLLPTPNQLLQPQVVDPEIVYREIRGKRISSKTQYDRLSGTEHEPIETGSYVYAKPPPNQRGKPWAYGQVIHKDNTRSYKIKTPGSTLRRNRVQIKPAAAPPPSNNYNSSQRAHNQLILKNAEVQTTVPSSPMKPVTDRSVTAQASPNITQNVEQSKTTQPGFQPTESVTDITKISEETCSPSGDDFNFPIVNILFTSSNNPTAEAFTAFTAYISQL
ncbi:uncharacterized protein K02A2.6-like [Haliotis rufescens]|uniref:uncharacterized protein K02A2.6-like n=1 Tax=Haliotis rufescens TaxID=6454 RepID=UPI00201F6238|nr:uncharacterized protein K02A2.6-like [Haliotis rufescens]